MSKPKPNTEFKAYLDLEQFDKFSKFLYWLKCDREKKQKKENKISSSLRSSQ